MLPGVVDSSVFELTGLPVPCSPTLPYGDELHVGGRQNAVIAAVPGKTGVRPVLDTGAAIGVVDVKVSDRPVMGLPRVSMTVAVNGSVLFGFTVTTPLTVLGEVMVIVLGGQTETRPAVELEFALLAVTTVVPGASAVTTPLLLSSVTTPLVCAVKLA